MIDLNREELQAIYDILADYVEEMQEHNKTLKEEFADFDNIIIAGVPSIETVKSVIAKVATCLYSAPQ